MPKGPWQVLHVDFYGPLPSGDYPLVAIDRYSRYPEVEIVPPTKASLVIPRLDKMFATHGIPEVIKSDNGPPFSGEEYTRYLKALGNNPKFSTPYWPQGNAEVERFMQPLGKAIKTAHAQGKPWKQELNKFLLQYRTAPHTTTKTPPAELLFNRMVKGKLPLMRKQNVVNKHKQAQENEKQMQRYNKQYADTRRNVKMQNIQVGDCVLVRQQRQNKLTSTFSTIPYTVIRRSKSQITARSESGHVVTRNISHFMSIPRQNDSKVESDTETCRKEPLENRDQERLIQNSNEDTLLRRSSRDRKMPSRYVHPIFWKQNQKTKGRCNVVYINI